MRWFDVVNSRVNGVVWGWPMMALLIGVGLYLTARLCLVQVRGFRRGTTLLTRGDGSHEGEISHFQALSAALSATIGVGNIVGVATAISVGGPGAVFWMWMTAFVGMATKYSSCLLSVKYRRIDDRGVTHGGPMHYIERGMGPKWKWMAVLFAVFTIGASFGIGNMAQINALTVNLHSLLFADPASRGQTFNLVVGICVAGITGAVILKGIKRIGRVASILVPLMGLGYVLVGLVILARNAGVVPGAFQTILTSAFVAPEAVAGGLLGGVIRNGVARGLFSNEAGMGSAPITHGAARTSHPVHEGLVAMLGPFFDTLVVCSITALVIVVTGAATPGLDKTLITGQAFTIGLNHPLGASFVSFTLILFVFSTLIGWSYYGDRAADYLFGEKAVLPYRLLFLGLIILGACMKWDAVVNFSDTMNGLMAVPNLIALVALSPVVVKLTRAHFQSRD